MPVLVAPDPDATELIASSCSGCGYTAFPPLPACPECFSGPHEERPLTGLGTLYSYSRVHVGKRAKDGPYILGYVDTDEGARVYATIVDSAAVALDARVRLTSAAIPPTFEVIEGST